MIDREHAKPDRPTTLVRTLADSVGRWLAPGDEIIVTNTDHEADIGPWLGLQRFGVRFRINSSRATSTTSSATACSGSSTTWGSCQRARAGLKPGAPRGLDPNDGVVRVSMVHYSTVAEVDRLIVVLDEII